MKITNEDIQDLIKFGSNTGVDPELLLSFKHRDYINLQHWSTENISDLELISVYKALIKLERELKWIGGSVAAAIWVYRVIRQRRLDDDYQLADYGLQNCDNRYVPFGNHHSGERNIEDYFLNRKERSRRRVIKAEEDEKFKKWAQDRREKRSAAIAEVRKLSFEQRGLIRAKFLEKYRNATIQQRLELMAADVKYPPEYYPPEWIRLSRGQIQELPIDLLRKLFDKLSTKTKGEWRRFAQELQKIEEVN